MQIKGLGILLRKHLLAKGARPAVRWMNRFAAAACALGLCAWLTTLNVMEGLQKEIRLQHLMQKPHLLLEGALRTDLDGVSAKIQEKLGPHLNEVTLRLQMEGLLEPVKDRKIYTGSGVVIEGSAEVGSGTVVIGGELAHSLDAESMESFRLRNVWNLEGAPLELKPGGTRRSGLFDVDRFYVWVNEDDLQAWLGGKYKSRVEIFLEDPFQAPELLAAAQTVDPKFRDWKELDFALWHSLDLEKKAMAIALFFVVLFGALAVSSALSLRVTEKRREIGLLQAIGATKSKIFWLFEWEAIALAAFSFLIGLGLSWVASWAIQNWGMLPEFFYSQNLPVDWSWTRAGVLYATSLATVALASSIPARKLFRWDIASLLRS